MLMSSQKCCRLFILPFLTLLLCAPAAAQNERDRDSYTNPSNSVEISGQVKLADGLQPAKNVLVRVERFGAGGFLEQMTTDNRGKFRFAALPRGQYMVSVSAPCFAAAQQQVELQVIFRSYLLFELRPESSSPACRGDASSSSAAAVIDARVPAEAREELAKARAALREKKPDEGLEHLHRAIRLYKDFYEAQFLLGTTQMEMRRFGEAERALRRASELRPESTPALVSLGEVHRQQKRYADAEKVLLAGLKHDDESWLGHFTLGRVYLEMNDAPRAAPHLGLTLQLKPDFAEAHLVGGNVLLRLDQPERALLEYEEYLRLQPDGEYAPQARELVRKIRKALADKKK
jgi:tetratricopeptide (TPR) repeat protein